MDNSRKKDAFGHRDLSKQVKKHRSGVANKSEQPSGLLEWQMISFLISESAAKQTSQASPPAELSTMNKFLCLAIALLVSVGAAAQASETNQAVAQAVQADPALRALAEANKIPLEKCCI